MNIGNYRSPLRQMLYDSPLRTFVGKVIFAVIVLVIASFAIQTWIGWLTPLSSGWIILLSCLVAVIGSLPGIALIYYLDRREPESWTYYVGIFLLAALLTPALAAHFNAVSPFSLLTVGFNEEFCKAIPLLLLVFFAPNDGERHPRRRHLWSTRRLWLQCTRNC
jgi:RsiW-degrading membrane proteinase PrsW (M82 family)